MPKAVIFDLDGTLLNTLEDLRSAVNYSMKKHGFPERSLEEIRCFVGNGVKVLVDRACPEETPECEREQCLADFKKQYSAHSMDRTVPYEGIAEMLDRCHSAGFLTAVVSNKFEEAVRDLCCRMLPGGVDYCVGDKEGFARKPDPANVFRCMRQMGIESVRDAVYIGDSETDVRTAQNAGLPMIIVTWGFRERPELLAAGADCLADTPEELYRKIRGILGQEDAVRGAQDPGNAG